MLVYSWYIVPDTSARPPLSWTERVNGQLLNQRTERPKTKETIFKFFHHYLTEYRRHVPLTECRRTVPPLVLSFDSTSVLSPESTGVSLVVRPTGTSPKDSNQFPEIQVYLISDLRFPGVLPDSVPCQRRESPPVVGGVGPLL